MSGGGLSAEDWGERYRTRRPAFSGYTEALESLFPQLLEQAQISYVQVDGRTKDVPNFVNKLQRKGEKYEDPLGEVTDLSGIRIVLYYLDDVERVGRMIEDQFEVDSTNSGDKAASMDPDRFGYLSTHYVVRPSATRSPLPEWREFADLWAEIQVRTVLQHAWGAISRKLAYASVREAPRDLQRNLNRLSALLELADDEFVDIRLAREGIERQYDREVERGNLDLEIDESSLDSYIRESSLEEKISALARAAGSPQRRNEDPARAEERRQEKMSDLLSVLRTLGIDRISQFDERLDGLWDAIPAFMATVNEQYQTAMRRPIADVALNWLVLILFWADEVGPEKFAQFSYAGQLVDAIMSTYRESPD